MFLFEILMVSDTDSDVYDEIVKHIVDQCTVIDQKLWLKLKSLFNKLNYDILENQTPNLDGIYSEPDGKIDGVHLSDQDIEVFKKNFVKEEMKASFERFE